MISGPGERADWYRNVRSAPSSRVETGGRSYAPVCRFLSTSETYAELQGYMRRNPWAAPLVRRLFGLRFDASDTIRQARIEALRGVGFRPADRG